MSPPPPILTVFKAFIQRKGKLSDIEFLAIKEFDSKLRTNEGGLDGATGDVATLTANTGKDMYLAKAKISSGYDGTGTLGLVAELSLNGTVVETVYSNGAVGNIGIMDQNYEFVNIGQKVAAGEIIKIAVTGIGTGIHVEGTVVCFEEDTGADPRI